jgi:hypothetical protein
MIALFLCVQALDAVHQEVDGGVAIEVESAAPAGDWKAETRLAGWTGASYYTWTGPDLFGAPGKGTLAYAFHVLHPGRYRLLLRNRHDFEDSTLQNDCFTRLDGGTWLKTFSSQRGQWTWATNHEHEGGPKPPASYELSAGLHTLELSGRSRGFSVDRIHLMREGAAGGEDASRAPSPTRLEWLLGPGPYGPRAPLAARARSGRGLGEVLAALRRDPDGAAMRDALLRALDAEFAVARSLADPVEALGQLDLLAAAWAGDEAGDAVRRERDARKADPAVQAELKAHAAWKRIADAEAALRPQNGSRDPKSEGFRRLNARAIDALLASARALVAAHPGTAAARRVQALLDRYR